LATKKPNILILWGDDIGYWNVSAYNQGMMGYRTPNIDRIAKEGALFTDWYGQQSCTAGRACFITGQSGFRTGMLKVGLPGAKEGLQARDVTIAELLKAQGYMTAQLRPGRAVLQSLMVDAAGRTFLLRVIVDVDQRPAEVIVKVSYDSRTDIVTVILRDGVPVAESDEDKPGVILDYDDGGNLVAVEILDASKRVTDARRVEFQMTE
jgi:uncharacterized protein YuzE